MTFKSKSIPLLVAAIAALGTACGVQSQTDTASVEVLTEAEVVAAKEKRHAAESQYVKPGADVRMSHDFKGYVTPGSSGNVQVTLTSKQQGGSMSVRMSSEGGLALADKTPQKSFAMKSASGVQTLDIPFSTQAPGLKYINIVVNTTDEAGQSLGRAFSIPIQVGDPALNPAKPTPSNLITTPSGEKLMIMEAEQTIIQKSE